MNFSRLVGGDAVIARARRVLADVSGQVGGALFQEAQIVMTQAKQRTPVSTGALRASGIVFPPERSGDVTSVTLAFGGVAAPYAVHIHEDLDVHHPVGQAKFLESAFLEAAPSMAGRIASRLQLKG